MSTSDWLIPLATALIGFMWGVRTGIIITLKASHRSSQRQPGARWDLEEGR